jgi:hypothetical protein
MLGRAFVSFGRRTEALNFFSSADSERAPLMLRWPVSRYVHTHIA